jgi:hypothetical protein
MLIRKISGADAPARATMMPVVKNRLNAGATWGQAWHDHAKQPELAALKFLGGLFGDGHR